MKSFMNSDERFCFQLGLILGVALGLALANFMIMALASYLSEVAA